MYTSIDPLNSTFPQTKNSRGPVSQQVEHDIDYLFPGLGLDFETR